MSSVFLSLTAQSESRVAIVKVSRNAHASAIVRGTRMHRSGRLLRHADFERVYKEGKRHFEKHMTVFYRRRPNPGDLRIGITVSRALGGAVVRNRMKRRLREALRMQSPAAGIAVDVVINPKKSLLGADFSELLLQVGRAFEVIFSSFIRG